MLVVKIEIWPYGDKKKKRKLYELKIANISNNPDVADYMIDVNNGDGLNLLRDWVNKHVRSDGLFVLMKKVFTKIAKKNIDQKQRTINTYMALSTFLKDNKNNE